MTAPAAPPPPRRHRGAALWLGLLAACVLMLAAAPAHPWLVRFPAGWQLPIADWVRMVAEPLFASLRPAGLGLATLLSVPLEALRAGLLAVPWPALILAAAAISAAASGPGLALFAALSLGAVVAVGYWPQAMSTLALVLMTVPLAVSAGFVLGAVVHRRSRLHRPAMVVLDVMQTFPAFAYLIPLLLLFGFGPVAGLVSSVIFALPPMVRNTVVGLCRVPSAIIEAALMSGATPRQLFWLARVPAARAQLLVGVNQTTMYALSMVIIVAIIGGFNDIGWEVLSAMRLADLGRSLLSGGVIVILAVLLDRVTRGFAEQPRRGASRRVVLGLVLAAGATAAGLRLAFPGEALLPDALGRILAGGMNDGLMWVIGAGAGVFEALRKAVTFGMMLPLRVGIGGAATPLIWGFSGGAWLLVPFAAASAASAALAWGRGSWRAGVAILAGALILWTGLPQLPWPGLIALTVVLAWRVAGPGVAALAAGTLGVALLGGMWAALMQSLYLVFLAVVISILVGGSLGVAAAARPRLAALLLPVADALQTMPQFVFLIPALMVFGVGEFAALIAIVLYSVVPPYRYVEHGLTHVPVPPVEAGIQMGATPRQLLWLVKAPLARHSLRLGLNQTIMAALSMLVIAALVGTRDLGQQIYVALGRADAGMGLVAGGIIACIGLVSDRMIRIPHGGGGRDGEQDGERDGERA